MLYTFYTLAESLIPHKLPKLQAKNGQRACRERRGCVPQADRPNLRAFKCDFGQAEYHCHKSKIKMNKIIEP